MKYYVTLRVEEFEEIEIEADSKEEAEERARNLDGDVINTYDTMVDEVTDITEDE